MVNIDKSQVPGLTGRALLEQIGYHKCASHGQKRYVLAVVAGHEWWVSLNRSTVILKQHIAAAVCWQGKLDERISKYQRHEVAATSRQRMLDCGYEILADIHGWRVLLLGDVLRDTGYQADQSGSRYAEVAIRRNKALAWQWARAHWKS
jgi:hypothetical protein